MFMNTILRFFITVFVLNTFYVYLYEFCYNYLVLTNKEIDKSIVYIGIHNLISSLILWIVFIIMIQPYPIVMKKYRLKNAMIKYFGLGKNLKYSKKCKVYDLKLNKDQERLLEKYVENLCLKLLTRNSYGQFNICYKCKIIRPDRCYHCSKCSTCVLKRDHHCPLLNKCIGFSNQKYFILLLLYILVYSFFFTVTISKCMGLKKIFANFNLMITLLILIFITIPTFCLFLNALYLTAKNLTTIENNNPPRLSIESLDKENIFDLGIKENFKEIFGLDLLLFLLPIWTTEGNGHYFKISNRENIV